MLQTLAFILLSPLLLLILWIGLRVTFCIFNYHLLKRHFKNIPAINDSFARLKVFAGHDPAAGLWKENISLAGKGNAFLPVVFVGPFLDMGAPELMVNSPPLIRELSDDTLFPKMPAIHKTLASVVGNGVAVSEGEHWKNTRQIINTLFHQHKLQEYGTCMTTNAKDLVETIKSKQSAELDCVKLFSETTLKIAIDGMFNRNDFEAVWVSDLLRQVTTILFTFVCSELLLGPVVNQFFPWKKIITKTRKIFQQKVHVICERARENSSGGSSFIEALVAARDSNGHQLFSDSQIADEVLSILVAAHETTTDALAWTIYFLCQHKHELEKLQSEVDAVLRGRPPDINDINNLHLCKNAVMEALRLRPAGTGVERVTKNDCNIGNYRIPKGTTIMLNWHAAHTDPTLWENPEDYNPDRFLNAGYTKNFFAFSYGPRNCVGQKFAMNESIILLASIVQNFDIYMGSAKVRAVLHVAQEPLGLKCKFVPRK